MLKKTVYLRVRVTMEIADGLDVDEAINELDYEFKSTTPGAVVLDTEITDQEEVDQD